MFVASIQFGTASTSDSNIATSDRWYVKIEDAMVNEYVRNQSTGSENTAEELSKRLAEVKYKQEITNVKLQHLNEFVENLIKQ